ncbi:N-acetylmuramoyl-L-alanine amidase [Paracoccus seriniphilus]|uniref:N-acetylmuramoyl-L-alanine amidase n=1 Tax=Paracoccus seriniphilus TaxID=184748 RepID=A0A239Q306_9RHOB|nr:N-acetylmuramoyl-L-alanine amidase [Paracoccus seriniphilus]WCR13205.1 N-acetylmuramoyl-L-alanine amidase [Paracoccus seriniphilus]SNT76698.1 N-acetylmuramoyl-L-alanine amidase [Paracoccus seriniphilus]
MKRIIWHWTAGSHRASALDRDHYHLLIEGDGTVVYGTRPISANAAPLAANYARHTASLNTDSIGIAVCAMHGAVQSPFSAGQYPITEEQLHQLVRETARLAKGYGIPVSRQTILSHAEVQLTLGVKQAGKWDIAWLPGRTSATDPIGCGDHLRYLVAQELAGKSSPAAVADDPAPEADPKKSTPVAPALIFGGAIGAFAILKLMGVI